MRISLYIFRPFCDAVDRVILPSIDNQTENAAMKDYSYSLSDFRKSAYQGYPRSKRQCKTLRKLKRVMRRGDRRSANADCLATD